MSTAYVSWCVEYKILEYFQNSVSSWARETFQSNCHYILFCCYFEFLIWRLHFPSCSTQSIPSIFKSLTLVISNFGSGKGCLSIVFFFHKYSIYQQAQIHCKRQCFSCQKTSQVWFVFVCSYRSLLDQWRMWHQR